MSMENIRSSKSIASWIPPILLALGLVIVIRTFLFSPMIVDGASMEPTLHDHERIIVSKTISWTGDVNRGDIVIIKGDDRKTNYVKRAIGLPGDIIEMKDDQLFINEQLVKEPYLKENMKAAKEKGTNLTEDFGPITVPENSFFVMGDNRFNSIDSRSRLGFSLGFIERDRIIGKSKFVLFPFKNIRATK
ncbi:signal peptidase I [Siminovitchia fortis]|uniref:Signal peptidase I n=2 Tax=Siminovitchia fortis TaxID=254758 RepID=A0A443IZN6_9BACI|nr:signal peptidase I [Siminovitchia fortis]RWR13661.1 signal peptidase I [Siminovitchia fortis]WHY81875.1 signal peptidase I [Siminovitchia fortis]